LPSNALFFIDILWGYLRGQPLSVEYKAHNKALSKQRVFIEHVNRRCKIFRIVKDVYRGKHKNYSLTWNLVAALVNLRYACILYLGKMPILQGCVWAVGHKGSWLSVFSEVGPLF
jgi:hypothetical protein